MHKYLTAAIQKRENGTLELPVPEPKGEAGPYLHYFMLVGDAFTCRPWLVKRYNRRQLTREERIANHRILTSQDSSGGCIWNPSKQIN